MGNGKVIAGLVLGAAMSAVVSAQEKGGVTLTPQDYTEIRELYSQFAWSLDSGADNGMAYARKFTPDGEFRYGSNSTVGREKLAGLLQGTQARDGAPRHYTTNILIEPSQGGARGFAYVLLIGLAAGEGGGWSEEAIGTGTYEDTLVKTSEGWRIKQRILYLNGTPPSVLGAPSPE